MDLSVDLRNQILTLTHEPFVNIGKHVLWTWLEENKILQGELEVEHIEAFIQDVVDIYMNPAMSGYLSFVVFANARFANPALINKPEYDATRRATLLELLRLYNHNPENPLPEKEEPAYPGERCAYCSEPALIRASRMIIPMIGSEDAINFVPEGLPKLPICGSCLLGLLVMPLGGLNSEGKMWLIYSHDQNLTGYFVQEYYRRNKQTFAMDNIEKVPNYKFARTQMLNALNEIAQELQRNTSISAYRFVSGGQTPSIEIYHLPTNVVEFMRLAKINFPQPWNEVVQTAWETTEDTVTKQASGKEQLVHQQRNFFFEDLMELPIGANRFLKRYLLRIPRMGSRRGKFADDPRFEFSFLRDYQAISWGLTTLFLEKVMNMDRERIENIRLLADNLADYVVQSSRGEKLFKNLFYKARHPSQFRRELIVEANRAASNVEVATPLVPYELFVSVFFGYDENDFPKQDWYLAMDLLLIRVIERLHEARWIEQHAEIAEEAEEALINEQGD